jgi:hypothetical protein
MSMRRRGRVAVAAAALALGLAADAGASGGAPTLSVAVDRIRIATGLGDAFVFRSTITNTGSAAASRPVAHLNVLSLRDGVYVDPEDWSANRTRYLGDIPAGGSRTTTWRMSAVTAGSFVVYVAVLTRAAAAEPPTTGPAIRVAVAGRETLNPGGILPLTLGIPALIALLMVGVALRRGRRVAVRPSPGQAASA